MHGNPLKPPPSTDERLDRVRTSLDEVLERHPAPAVVDSRAQAQRDGAYRESFFVDQRRSPHCRPTSPRYVKRDPYVLCTACPETPNDPAFHRRSCPANRLPGWAESGFGDYRDPGQACGEPSREASGLLHGDLQERVRGIRNYGQIFGPKRNGYQNTGAGQLSN